MEEKEMPCPQMSIWKLLLHFDHAYLFLHVRNDNTSNQSERHSLLNLPLGLQGGGGTYFTAALIS